MIYLIFVSLIWAFSFGLIKGKLAGIDSNLVSFLRLFISFLFFLPFIRVKKYSYLVRNKLMLVGLIQYGVMYSAYIYSYQYLEAYEVALFTIFTPIYVTLINDIFNKKLNHVYLITSSIAVLGTAIVVFKELSNFNLIIGFIIVQISNMAFAFGQVAYKKVFPKDNLVKDHELFAWMFLGGLTFPLALSFVSVDLNNISISLEQWLVLLYLGIAASGVGFFLWNYGARRTNTGALAIFNNLKVPLAIAVSLIAFGETTNLTNLLIGGIIVLGSLLLNQYILSNSQKTIN